MGGTGPPGRGGTGPPGRNGKVVGLTDVAAAIDDGAHVAFTGFAIARNAVAAAHALIRAGRRNLTLTQVIGGMETDLLVGAGCVSHLNYSGGSLDRFGPLHAVNRAMAGDGFGVREYSSLSLTLRLHAGALGLPYIASRSMLGSQLLDRLLPTGEVRMGEDPFTGAAVSLMAPLRPDVAVVHADVADEHGNAAIGGPLWSIRDTAFAAHRLIVVAEEVVAVGELAVERVTIPGAIVEAVAVAPRGAWPTAVYGRYDYDRAHLQEYAAATKEGPDGFAAYLERYVTGVTDHDGYLAVTGGGS